MSHSKVLASSLIALSVLGAGCGAPPAAPAQSSSQGLARATADVSSGTTVVKPPPSSSTSPFVTSAATGLATKAAAIAIAGPTCATTAAIYDFHPAIPAGDGNACASDLDCGAGAFCSPGAGNALACHTSGLLVRGDIFYVAGPSLDLDLTVSACATVSDILQGGVSLNGSGGFDDTGKQYTILSSSFTTHDGQDATHLLVRVNLLNFGQGTTSPFEVRVTAPLPVATTSVALAPSAAAGTAINLGSTVSKKFTVAAVAAVNGSMRASIGETSLRTSFLVSMYREFGDTDEVIQHHDDGSTEEVAHDLDWSALGTTTIANQTHYTGTDLRIEEGQVVFSMKFKGEGFICDTDVDVDGAFTLVPALHGMKLQWLMGPNPRISAGTVCTLATVGLYAIAADIFISAEGIEDQIASQVRLQMEQSAGVDKNTGLIPVCPTCTVEAVHVGGGRIDVYATPGLDTVRVAASTTRYTDTTKDPNSQGLIIPPATFVLVTSGGTYHVCSAADGTSAASCPGLDLDALGTFNWWGSDVPVPTPWPVNQYGAQGFIGARYEAWQRLIPLGVTRHPLDLPSPTLPSGALLARRGGGATNTPGPHLRVQPGCMVAPDATDATSAVATRIAFGVNDLPSVGTEPPTSGQLDVTVVLPEAALSQTLFSGATPCAAEPPLPFHGQGIDLSNVASTSVSLAN